LDAYLGTKRWRHNEKKAAKKATSVTKRVKMKVAPAAWIQRVTTLKNRTMITEATTEYIKVLESKTLLIAKKPNEAETNTCISRDEHKIPIIPKREAAGIATAIKTRPSRK
jgi:hypothetical protein